MSKSELLPEIAALTLAGRDVAVVFDSDISEKPRVQAAEQRLTEELTGRGAVARPVRLPAGYGGGKNGVDDYLLSHTVDDFIEIVRNTQPTKGSYDPPITLYTLMAASLPPTEFVWADFILKGETNLLFGDGGVGKSLLALYVAVAVAAGRPLFANTTTQMPVLCLFAEDGATQVQQRLTTILIELGVDAKGDLPIKLWCQPREDTLLAKIDDNGLVTELPRLRALRAELAKSGRPALLILDSLADLFALNESLRLPVNAALKRVLGGLCRDFDATVIVLAHPSKTSMQDGTRYSGSTAFNNAVRQRLTLEILKREPGGMSEGPPPRVLRVEKSNYGPPAEKTLWYYGATIMELPRATGDDGRAGVLRKVCVAAAIEAANKNVPFNRKTVIPEIVFKDAEKAIGRRPTSQQLKNALEEAVHAGELQHVSHTRHRATGYYPPELETALDLAKAAKRAANRASRESGDA